MYCLRYGFKPSSDGFTCYYALTNHFPTREEIISETINLVNQEITDSITEFNYNGFKIWLTLENQNDFLLAKAGGLTTLSVKAEQDGSQVYIDVDLNEFLPTVSNHIITTLTNGRNLKDELIVEINELFDNYAKAQEKTPE